MRRHRQLEAEIQRTLAELIAREVKDPRVGNVTITAVELAADLSTARVFFVPFAARHDAGTLRPVVDDTAVPPHGFELGRDPLDPIRHETLQM